VFPTLPVSSGCELVVFVLISIVSGKGRRGQFHLQNIGRFAPRAAGAVLCVAGGGRKRQPTPDRPRRKRPRNCGPAGPRQTPSALPTCTTSGVRTSTEDHAGGRLVRDGKRRALMIIKSSFANGITAADCSFDSHYGIQGELRN